MPQAQREDAEAEHGQRQAQLVSLNDCQYSFSRFLRTRIYCAFSLLVPQGLLRFVVFGASCTLESLMQIAFSELSPASLKSEVQVHLSGSPLPPAFRVSGCVDVYEQLCDHGNDR